MPLADFSCWWVSFVGENCTLLFIGLLFLLRNCCWWGSQSAILPRHKFVEHDSAAFCWDLESILTCRQFKALSLCAKERSIDIVINFSSGYSSYAGQYFSTVTVPKFSAPTEFNQLLQVSSILYEGGNSIWEFTLPGPGTGPVICQQGIRYLVSRHVIFAKNVETNKRLLENRIS